MERDLEGVSQEATAVCLTAGGLLILAGLVGLTGTLPLVLGLLALATALHLLRRFAPETGLVLGHDVGQYLYDAWTAPGLAAVAILVVFGASPGELQATGGLVGLAGMANYFLRPLYVGLVELVVGESGDEDDEESVRA